MRTALFAVVVLGVVAYGYFGVYVEDQQKAQQERDEKKLVSEPIESITVLEFADGDQVKRFEKIDGDWMLLKPVKGRADQIQVRNILTAILATQYEQKLYSKGEEYKSSEFGLEDSNKFLRLSSKQKEFVFNYGKTKTYDGNNYVFAEHKKELIVVNKQIEGFFNKSLFDLRDKVIVPGKAESVSKITVVPGGKPFNGEKFELIRDGGEDWKIPSAEDKKVDASEVKSFIQRLVDLRTVEFVAESKSELKKFFLNQPVVKIIVDGVTYSFGRDRSDAKYAFVVTSDRNYVSKIYGNLVDHLLVKVSDFLNLNYMFQVNREGISELRLLGEVQGNYLKKGDDWVAVADSTKKDSKKIIKQAQVDSLLNRIVNLKGVAVLSDKKAQTSKGKIEIYDSSNKLVFGIEWGDLIKKDLGPTPGEEEYFPVKTTLANSEIIAIPRRELEPLTKGIQ